MEPTLAGRHAVVTGGAHGIGRASVERFVEAGAQVTALDIDAVALAELQQGCGCATQVIDLTDAAAIAAFTASAGDVDILFLCAGIVTTGTILDCGEDDWARSFDLNVTAMYRMIGGLLPGMIARRRGSIVTMSSVAGGVRGVPDRFAYAVSKAAVVGLTKAVAADFAGDGIRCNAICPGTIDTAALGARMATTADPAATRLTYTARQPMGRFGTVSEIAELALFLASDAASFTTGQCFIADGGWSN